MKIIIRLIQTCMILVPIILLGWLWVQNSIPSGSFVVHHSVHDRSAFIDPLQTHERVTEPFRDEQGTWVQKIFGDPVFFFVHPHQSFVSVTTEVWFQNHGAPIVEFGALSAKDPERYTLIPLQNTLIDHSSWPRVVEGDTMLLERTPRYRSLADFRVHPPALNTIATYHADVEAPFRLKEYVPTTSVQSIDVSLRGAHRLKTYLKQETLSFTFSFMDMNRDRGADPVVVSVFDEHGTPVAEARADDDGDLTLNAFPSRLRTLELTAASLPEGVYTLDVRASRDIFFRSIKTTQQKIIFLNGVYVGDEVAYRDAFRPITFWTEASRLSFLTRHAESVQTVKINQKPFAIESPYRLFTAQNDQSGLLPVSLTKGDVEVRLDAPLAFAPGQFFRPDPVRLLPHTNLDTLGVDYILATYTPPLEEDGWLKATVSLNADELLLDQGSWKFTFSTPEIDELGGSVLIKRMEMQMKK